MATERNRDERLEIRISPEEKQAFQEAAEVAGASLSSWVRDRLRIASRRELLESGRKVPFIRQVEG